MSSFWTRLPKPATAGRPFFAQAPMEDVTDAAFRRLIASYGKPDVMFTEFTSADGLFFANPVRSRACASAPEGSLGRATSNEANESGWKKLQAKLLFSDSEHPIVAQLFSSSPERMEKVALMVKELGFDGIDINMGCPDKAVEKSGCGAALIKNPKLARELIRTAGTSGLPISVKTRTGYLKDDLDTWLPELLAENPAAVTIHARTRKEMSDVPARWDTVARAVAIRDKIGSLALIIGNGDVADTGDGRAKAEASGCDGVMLGRAIYGNPWLFSCSQEHENVTPKQRLAALAEHLELFEDLLGGITNYATMKKHFKAYVHGWPGAKELRVRLMETEKVREAQAIIIDVIIHT